MALVVRIEGSGHDRAGQRSAGTHAAGAIDRGPGLLAPRNDITRMGQRGCAGAPRFIRFKRDFDHPAVAHGVRQRAKDDELGDSLLIAARSGVLAQLSGGFARLKAVDDGHVDDMGAASLAVGDQGSGCAQAKHRHIGRLAQPQRPPVDGLGERARGLRRAARRGRRAQQLGQGRARIRHLGLKHGARGAGTRQQARDHTRAAAGDRKRHHGSRRTNGGDGRLQRGVRATRRPRRHGHRRHERDRSSRGRAQDRAARGRCRGRTASHARDSGARAIPGP